MLQYQIFHHVVSIHAPYAGSDRVCAPSGRRMCCFNPHPLCRERPRSSYPQPRPHNCFNPRPLCRERRTRYPRSLSMGAFQSTPPMQGATIYCERDIFYPKFQSTPPMQGATLLSVSRYISPSVSIHAPYAGSDPHGYPGREVVRCFNPRPLCRERHQRTPAHLGCWSFNPRPLCRERL